MTSGHKVIFCDKPDNEYVEVESKKGKRFRLDEKDDFIEIRNQQGSYILMKEKDIEIHAAGKIKATAQRIDLN